MKTFVTVKDLVDPKTGGMATVHFEVKDKDGNVLVTDSFQGKVTSAYCRQYATDGEPSSVHVLTTTAPNVKLSCDSKHPNGFI